jgi:hypothetical protein
MTRVRLSLMSALIAGVLAAGLAPRIASASIGTGVGADPLVLAGTAVPGHSYELPRLYLVNTGTETSRYALAVTRIDHGAQRDVPAGWVVLPAAPVTLGAKNTTYVPLTLRVPADAPLGDYMTDVVAGTMAHAGGAGAAVGAKAAAQLLFTVGHDSGGLPSPPLWVDLALLAAAVMVGVGYAVRRSGLRLHVERRR